jgi:hypothetical protein
MGRQGTDYIIEFGDDSDPRSIEGRARVHQGHRERVVATILTDLHLMAVADIFPSTILVGAEKAYWQDVKGSKAKGTEAAHCVPCQIRITGKLPEQYLRKFSSDRADTISAYFGKTTPFLPLIFNDCDQKCEQDGLINAFHDACIEVINSGYHSQDFRFSTVTTSIRGAFSTFEAGARFAYINAVNFYEKEKASCQRFSTAAKIEEAKVRSRQIRIVKHYIKELDNSSAIDDIIRFGEINDLINLYKTFK